MTDQHRLVCFDCRRKGVEPPPWPAPRVIVRQPKPDKQIETERRCLSCGDDISNRHQTALYCYSCADARVVSKQFERNEWNRAKAHVERFCNVCRASLASRSIGAVYCHDCAAKRKEESILRAQERRKSKALDREINKCDDCGTDISARNGNAMRCLSCAEARNVIKRREANRLSRERNKANAA